MAFKIKDGLRVGLVDVLNNTATTVTLQDGTQTHTGALSLGALSTDRTYTLPNASGTIALTSDLADTTYSISSETGSGGANLRLTDSGAGTDDVLFEGGTNVTVTRTDASTITIAAVDTDTTYAVSAETDASGASLRLTAGGSGAGTDDVLFAEGSDISITRTDASTITIAYTGVSTDTNQTISADATDADRYITSVASATGGQQGFSHTGLLFNPSSGTLKVGSTFTIDPATHGDNTGTVVIAGNLTINGTTTTVNSNTVNIGDNILVLNSDEAGTPSQNAGIEVERGTSTNVDLRWNETADRWEFTNDGATWYNIPIPAEYDTNSDTTYTISTEAGGNAYQEIIRLTAGGSGAGTDDVILGVGQTDSVYGLGIAESGDTITFTHGDTSTLTGQQGSAGISNITVDGMGHVTAVGTATYLTAESDTLASVTGRGATTATDIQLNGAALKLAVSSSDISEKEAITASIATTDPGQVVDSWAIATYRSCKYLVQVTAGTDYQVSEIMVIHNGTTTTMTEYAVLETNGVLATFSSDVNAGSARLLVDLVGASANIKLDRTLITV